MEQMTAVDLIGSVWHGFLELSFFVLCAIIISRGGRSRVLVS